MSLISAPDRAVVAAQLGRSPRAVRAVAHRCPCGNPDVVETSPRLPDGTPFPTLYYLTCSRLAARIGTLESEGRMRELTERLAADPELARPFAQRLWDAPVPDGHWRYYNGLLYFLGLLETGGRFKVIPLAHYE